MYTIYMKKNSPNRLPYCLRIWQLTVNAKTCFFQDDVICALVAKYLYKLYNTTQNIVVYWAFPLQNATPTLLVPSAEEVVQLLC